jgi:AmmeMemoRadiSam system protein B
LPKNQLQERGIQLWAGSFYPREQLELTATVEALMSRTSRSGESGLVGVIAPHAGYMYSGPAAASAFASLETEVKLFDRVCISFQDAEAG